MKYIFYQIEELDRSNTVCLYNLTVERLIWEEKLSYKVCIRKLVGVIDFQQISKGTLIYNPVWKQTTVCNCWLGQEQGLTKVQTLRAEESH